MKPKDNTPPGWNNEPPEFFHDGVQACLETIREECEASEEIVVRAFPITLWKTALRYSVCADPMPRQLSCNRTFLRLVGAIITAQDEVTPLTVWRDWRQQIHYDERPIIHPGTALERTAALHLMGLREGWKGFTAQRKKGAAKTMGHKFQKPPSWNDLSKMKADSRKVGEIVPVVRKSEGALYVEKSRERKRMREILMRWRFAFVAWLHHSAEFSGQKAEDIFQQKLDRL